MLLRDYEDGKLISISFKKQAFYQHNVNLTGIYEIEA